jgi:predicted O-methyltransferase YrrM
MEFTQDWFSHNIPTWTKLLSQLRGKSLVRALEIGVFEGRSTCWLLENVLTGDGATVDCIDTFAGAMEHCELDLSSLQTRFESNVTAWRSRVNVHVGMSAEILPTLIGPYDLLYIDGSHTARDVLVDTVLAWRLAADNAILIFDDYAWPKYPDQPWFRPQLAVDSFLACFAGWYEVLDVGYQMAIRKRAQFSPPAQMARPPAKTPALRADAWAFNSSSAEQTTYKIEIPQKRGFR